MKTRRSFLKSVLLALPLVPTLAKGSTRAMTAQQAPEPHEGSWGKGGIDWKPLQESTSIRVEHDPKNPDRYLFFFTGVGGQMEDSQEYDDEVFVSWGEY